MNMRQQSIPDYILVRLRRGDTITRRGLLNLYGTAEVHHAIWHLIEQGLIEWDATDYETLLLKD